MAVVQAVNHLIQKGLEVDFRHKQQFHLGQHLSHRLGTQRLDVLSKSINPRHIAYMFQIRFHVFEA